MTDIEERLKQTELLLEQEKGKNIALNRVNQELQRESKIIKEQAEALQAETANSLAEAANQMKAALAISQGIWALAHFGRAYMARKVAAARVTHREQQFCVLLEKLINNAGKDPAAMQAAVEQAKHCIATVRRDSEAQRVAAFEAAFTNGLTEFDKAYEQLLSARNVETGA